MNTEIIIIFYHEPMTIGDALFASTLALGVFTAIIVFLWKLLTIKED